MAQGLDRIILVSIRGPDTRNEFDEHVPGVKVVYRRWATRMDLDLKDIEEEAGTFSEARRDWVVRWFRELAESVPDLVSISEGEFNFNCTNIVEIAERRRRFLKVQGVAVE